MRTPWLSAALLVAGCATTPPGPTMEQFRAMEESNATLLRERTTLEARVGDLERMLEALQIKTEGITTECARLTTEAKRLERTTDDLAARLDARGGALPPGEPTVPVKGCVLAADSKMNIYLISIGSQDGVKVDDEFTVYRGDQFVAVIVVDKVFQDKASAKVKSLNGKAMLKSEIKTGDKVASAL